MRILAVILLSACATGATGDGDDVGTDGALPPDGVGLDASNEVSLSQSSATTIVAGNTLVCAQNDANNVVQFTLENHFYRSFPLAVSGVTGQFSATRVDLGIEDAQKAAGTQPIQVKLSTISGTFPGGALTPLRDVPVTVPNMTSQVLSIDLAPPVVVASGSTIVIEVVAPAHSAVGDVFFPGSNTAGETAPSYIMAADCGITAPTTYAGAVPGSMVHLVMSISGTSP